LDYVVDEGYVNASNGRTSAGAHLTPDTMTPDSLLEAATIMSGRKRQSGQFLT
jgi:hypothetical protein